MPINSSTQSGTTTPATPTPGSHLPPCKTNTPASSSNPSSTGGDSPGIPVAWYYPLAPTHPELLDTIPHLENGNTLTIRQYQQAWLDTYRQLAGRTLPIDGCNHAGGGDSQRLAPPSPQTCNR